MKDVIGKKGQIVAEYAVIFIAVASVLIVAVNRALRTQTCQIYKDMGCRLDQSSENLEDKFGGGLLFPGNISQTGNNRL